MFSRIVSSELPSLSGMSFSFLRGGFREIRVRHFHRTLGHARRRDFFRHVFAIILGTRVGDRARGFFVVALLLRRFCLGARERELALRRFHELQKGPALRAVHARLALDLFEPATRTHHAACVVQARDIFTPWLVHLTLLCGSWPRVPLPRDRTSPDVCATPRHARGR